jgi:CheY-like chemotaxis protein
MQTDPVVERLALVIDPDKSARRTIRGILAELGLDVVQAADGLVGLELIQRLPNNFHLIITDLDPPGLSGALIAETLRLFRPDLPVLCITDDAAAGVVPAGCVIKPLERDSFQRRVRAALEGSWTRWETSGAATERAVLRARVRYAEGQNLVEAALELARGNLED